VEHSGLSALGFFFRLSPRAVERGEGGVGVITIGGVQRIVWIVPIDGIERIVGCVAIRRIDGIAGIKAVDRVAGILLREGLRGIQRSVGSVMIGRIETEKENVPVDRPPPDCSSVP
jgi:hypothetical protein